jgi:hypothetical protein
MPSCASTGTCTNTHYQAHATPPQRWEHLHALASAAYDRGLNTELDITLYANIHGFLGERALEVHPDLDAQLKTPSQQPPTQRLEEVASIAKARAEHTKDGMKKNPNHVNLGRDDAKNSMATCPLMKSTMQLVPLCYGLVDDRPGPFGRDPCSLHTRHPPARHSSDARWLALCDRREKARTLGIPRPRWRGHRDALASTDVHSDRETPINKPVLIYPARAELHVCHSEIQWTAKKCRQVLYSPSERDYFMQAVDLGQANCETGGPGLLTPDQAERWLAEVACSGDDDSDPDPERTPICGKHLYGFMMYRCGT